MAEAQPGAAANIFGRSRPFVLDGVVDFGRQYMLEGLAVATAAAKIHGQIGPPLEERQHRFVLGAVTLYECFGGGLLDAVLCCGRGDGIGSISADVFLPRTGQTIVAWCVERDV